jgi:hypothetical protein
MPYFYRAEQEIAAPARVVWDVLADLDAYAEWNPFCPYVETDRIAGHPIVLYVDFDLSWPPRPREQLLRQVETISRFAPGEVLGWTAKLGHEALFRARREQRVEVLGERRCWYTSDERFAGPLAWLVNTLYAVKLQRAFDATAVALARRAESLAG